MRKYKLGVVGLGEGRSIMSAALNSAHWQLESVCDLNMELCLKRAGEFGFDRWTTKYEDMLNNPDIDAIAIYTPDQLHLKHIRMALEAGKHVICTKPLLPSLEGAKDLLDTVKRSGKRVFVGQSSRFFEPMIHQRKDYEMGLHGDIQTVEAHYITDGRWFLEREWSKQAGFSWMYGFMIHAIDMVRWYLPDIREVTGFGRISDATRSAGVESWDSMRFLVRDKDGRIGQIAGNYTQPKLGEPVEPSIGCTIRGLEGSSRAEYSNLRYYTRFAGQEPITHSYEEKNGYYFRFEGRSHHAGEYQNYIEYFARCLDGGIEPRPDAKEGVLTLALMAAMERTLKQGGKPVLIEDIITEHGLKGYLEQV